MASSANATGFLPPSALKVIGVGLAFPFAFSDTGGVKALAVASGIDKINQSIHIILSTRPGERVMNPEFGSRIPDLVFEPNDYILADLLYIYTVDALARWEKRIHVRSLNFPNMPSDVDNGIIRLQIRYTILATNQEGNYVFPFQRAGEPMSQVVTGNAVPAPSIAGQNLASPIVFGIASIG